MKTRTMRKVALLATSSALALSFPVASSFASPSDGNGHSKACQNVGKRHGRPKNELPSQAHKGNGWKCGF